MRKFVFCAMALALLSFAAQTVSAEDAVTEVTSSTESKESTESTAATEDKKSAESKESSVRVGDAYTLNICPVSGDELGKMGSPPVEVIDGREFRFCCGGCPPELKKDAAKVAKVDEKMIADQEPHYPLTTCVNSDGELKPDAVTFVVGNRVFKTCCKDCETKVKEDPATFIKKLDAAVIEKQKAAYKPKKDLVTDEDLKDDAIDFVVANRLIRLNGEASVKKFETNPSKYVADIDGASK